MVRRVLGWRMPPGVAVGAKNSANDRVSADGHNRRPSAAVVDPLTARIVQRTPVIDSLRALACVMVIVAHAVTFAGVEASDQLSWRVSSMGETGVALFFVISGYLIAGPFTRALVEGRNLPANRSFFLRRAARILPGWWVAFGVAVIVLTLMGIAIPAKQVILAHLALVQEYFSLGPSPLPVGWTLSLEFTFYIFVPVAAISFRRWGPAEVSADKMTFYLGAIWFVLTGCAVTQPLIRVPIHHDIFHYLLLPYSDLAIPAGFLAAFIPGIIAHVSLLPVASGGRAGRLAAFLVGHPALTATGITLAVAAGAFAYNIGTPAVAFALLSVGMGLLILLAVTHGPPHAHRLRWPARIGLLTYGLYLYHYTVGALVQHYGVTFAPGDVPVVSAVAGWLVPALVLFVLTLPIALMSWIAVERPLINFAARRSVPRTSPRSSWPTDRGRKRPSRSP